MSKETLELPLTRSWRDIPQAVKPRAMSREGRRRFLLRACRLLGAVATLVAAGWASWQVAQVWDNGSRHLPDAAEAKPIGKNLLLQTDGVLDQAWLAATLALPKKATLMDLDLTKLKARLLVHGQVATAALVRKFPATLSVRLTERMPIARVMAEAAGGERSALLVARDGAVYPGVGYDRDLIESLPWLDGIKLTPQAGGYAPIVGMDAVADLLGRAKLEADWLYRDWHAVSLARLESDGQIGVRLRSGTSIIFSAKDDFFGQLAKLDYILDTAASAHPGQPTVGEIDLSLGNQVPVRLIAAPAPAPAPLPVSPPSALATIPRIQVP